MITMNISLPDDMTAVIGEQVSDEVCANECVMIAVMCSPSSGLRTTIDAVGNPCQRWLC